MGRCGDLQADRTAESLEETAYKNKPGGGGRSYHLRIKSLKVIFVFKSRPEHRK
jgi:hypothetical protein